MALHEGHRERMRRQLKTSGMDSLSDVQVLEVALYYAIPRRDTNEIAHALLSRFGSLSGVLEAPRAELLKIDGMGESAADLLLLFVQMERRHMMDRGSVETILDTTYKCAQYLAPRFIGEPEEVVYLLCLDAKCKVLCCKEISRGEVNSADISIRRIVELALSKNATSVIIAHNHPGALPLPSKEDEYCTRLVKKALELVDIKLLDHIIVGGKEFQSLNKNGLM